jgi:cell division protein FtsI/penicillin-binding protein 2
MDNLTYEQRQDILDSFGKVIIKDVRDSVLEISMAIARQTTINPNDKKKYSILSSLSSEQQEAVCDLLSETITCTIYEFLEAIEQNDEKARLLISKDGVEYDMAKISEKMGSEIACYDDDGWIQKFSKIGRFVL